MLLVPTELRPSLIHGVGVFLLAPVKQGDPVWRFDSRIDRVYTEAELDSLPPAARDFVAIYAYWYRDANLWVHCGDNAKYFNHADRPALTVGRGFTDDIAARDLNADEEITCNYRHFYDNDEIFAKMGLPEAMP